jgi:hypothetical protein
VALPRTNVVPARPARDVTGAAARAAERRADVRRSAVFMMASIGMAGSIECLACCCVGGEVVEVVEVWGSFGFIAGHFVICKHADRRAQSSSTSSRPCAPRPMMTLAWRLTVA